MFPRTRQVGHSRSRNDARAMNFTAARNQSQEHSVRDPGTRLSRILSDHNASMWITANQVMTERAANQISALGSQRELAGHAANAVGSKKLSSLGCHSDFADWPLFVVETF